ncbi:MAG: hypothetical protein ACC628_12185 [Pirellulaceae bacterium]
MLTQKHLSWLLAATFALAMFMGAGPGIYLANEPQTWFGFPRLYVWALFWCAVETTVILAAYAFVWRSPNEERKRS